MWLFLALLTLPAVSLSKPNPQGDLDLFDTLLCPSGTVCRAPSQCVDDAALGIPAGTSGSDLRKFGFDECGPGGASICCPQREAVAEEENKFQGQQCHDITGRRHSVGVPRSGWNIVGYSLQQQKMSNVRVPYIIG